MATTINIYTSDQVDAAIAQAVTPIQQQIRALQQQIANLHAATGPIEPPMPVGDPPAGPVEAPAPVSPGSASK